MSDLSKEIILLENLARTLQVLQDNTYELYKLCSEFHESGQRRAEKSYEEERRKGVVSGVARGWTKQRRDGQAIRVTNPLLQLVAYYRFAKISLHSRPCATPVSTLRLRESTDRARNVAVEWGASRVRIDITCAYARMHGKISDRQQRMRRLFYILIVTHCFRFELSTSYFI